MKGNSVVLGKCLELNAYPKWSKQKTANNMMDELQKKYNPMKPNAVTSWKKHILSDSIAQPHMDILLSLEIYNWQLNPSDEHDQLLAVIEKLAPKPPGIMPG